MSCKYHFLDYWKQSFVGWPRELNALQLQKTHVNRKSTSKSRKHLHQFDSRCCKCSHLFGCVVSICSAFLYLFVCLFVFLICWCFFLFVVHFFIWLCCEHLQRVCCQIDEVVFLICRCFFYLQRVELSRTPYICLNWSFDPLLSCTQRD